MEVVSGPQRAKCWRSNQRYYTAATVAHGVVEATRTNIANDTTSIFFEFLEETIKQKL